LVDLGWGDETALLDHISNLVGKLCGVGYVKVSHEVLHELVGPEGIEYFYEVPVVYWVAVT
jgi:hypothetical protein